MSGVDSGGSTVVGSVVPVGRPLVVSVHSLDSSPAKNRGLNGSLDNPQLEGSAP